jgi:hypothetical protein
VGLCEAGLASEERDGQRAMVNPAKDFPTERFVHVDKFHLRIVRYQLWIGKVSNFLELCPLCI